MTFQQQVYNRFQIRTKKVIKIYNLVIQQYHQQKRLIFKFKRIIWLVEFGALVAKSLLSSRFVAIGNIHKIFLVKKQLHTKQKQR